jgi:hypothetical protein
MTRMRDTGTVSMSRLYSSSAVGSIVIGCAWVMGHGATPIASDVASGNGDGADGCARFGNYARGEQRLSWRRNGQMGRAPIPDIYAVLLTRGILTRTHT